VVIDTTLSALEDRKIAFNGVHVITRVFLGRLAVMTFHTYPKIEKYFPPNCADSVSSGGAGAS
jgi:hypothetical protein